MEPERWQQIETVFQSALDCDPEARNAFLDSSCAGDSELRREVESLLAALQNAGFTQSPAFQEGAQLLEDRARQQMAGRKLGPYRILREIGRGGMGVVYLGARADEAFKKQVAIKILPAGLACEDIIQRFRGERQILATLDHPNITRLFDGGATEDGLPYLVMEYIEGDPIDEYCDTRKLNVTARLKLFQEVCAAVRYAHQNLVVHRDIKPSNVLITKEGVPRLLDFGIAKLLAPDTGSGAMTMTALHPLTPEYASPEQVRGGAITTATDVYSLGVLLYRLLTGRRPYYGEDSSSPSALARAICEEEPKKPSEQIASSEAGQGGLGDNSLAAIAGVREGTVEKLRRRLTGDLDNIVLMALRKEPQRRYASADQLSGDVSRHLNHLPVTARPDTRGYRISKFARRNRVAVASSALLFFVLTAGLAATLWQAHVARQQRDRARIEQAKADRIKSFLTDMLNYSSPEFTSSNPAKNRDAKVSEVVDQAAKRAEAELVDQPEVLAEVQSTIGGVYANIGRLEQAEAILRAAREKYVRLYGLNSHQTVEVSGTLANVLLERGNPTGADALFRENIEIERRLTSQGQGSPKNLFWALAGYGSMLDQRNDRAAEGYLREALKYSYEFAGKERVQVAMLYNNLSNEAGYRGDEQERERLLRASLDEYNKLPSGTYVEKATALSNLGALLIAKGQYAEAEPYVLEGLELRRKILGDAHVGTASALYRLSDLRYREGKYDEAEKAARESMEVFRRALPAPQDNALFTNPVLETGMILDKMGRFHEAEAYLRQALEIRIRLLSKSNQLIGKADAALAECLTAQKRYGEAESLLLDSYQIIKSTAAANDPRLAEAAGRLASFYREWGKPQKEAMYAVPQALPR